MTQARRHQVGFAEVLLAEQGIFRLRVSAAEDLLDEGARMVDETGRQPIGGPRLLLVVQATRAVHIFESVIALCRIGRGVPASMLNRALFEDVLDVHWVAANPTVAPARADQHERLIELGERALDEGLGRPTVPLSAGERTELTALRQQYSDFRASWTLSSTRDRIALVKDVWGEEATRNVDVVYEVIQRQNNTLLHGSPIAYALAMTPGRAHPNRVGPDPRWREALAHGVLGFYMIFRVLAEEFGLDKTAIIDRYHLSSCLAKTFSNEHLADVSPDAECPCGSGRALKDCHRS